METKHTKGEWRYRFENGVFKITSQDGSILIAETESREFPSEKYFYATPCGADANAKLIHAAPILLFELKRCVDFIKSLSNEGIEPNDEELLKDANNAIKKATE